MNSGSKLAIIGFSAALLACGGRNSTENQAFTKIDSLTENYLSFQDSMLTTWNVIMKDETKKISAMHELVHTLLSSQQYDKAQLISLEQRLDQLERIRFNQKTMANLHIVEEYDFASNSLVSEIISLAESDASFPRNANLQRLVDNIKIADQRMVIYRSDYDSVTMRFNHFLDENKSYLESLDEELSQEKRPLFQMAEN
jgi:hypothetical protein